MILKDLLNHFEIDADLPDYLLSQTFNEVFMDGNLSVEDNIFKIVVKTRQDVVHQMYIEPDGEFPVIILSELPSGLSNGMKFPKTESVGIPIDGSDM